MGRVTRYRESENNHNANVDQRTRYIVCKRATKSYVPCTMCYCICRSSEHVALWRTQHDRPLRDDQDIVIGTSGRRSSSGALLLAFTWGRDNAENEDETSNTFPNAMFSRKLSRSLNTIAHLAPPMPRRSRKTLISCKWALGAHRFAERPCTWLDVGDECDRVKGYVTRPT